MSKTLAARIRFLGPDEGGLSRPPGAGVRPHLKLGEIFTSCIVRPKEPVETFAFGREHEVTLELVFWDDYGHLYRQGMVVELYDGNKLVAKGRFLDTPPPG